MTLLKSSFLLQNIELFVFFNYSHCSFKLTLQICKSVIFLIWKETPRRKTTALYMRKLIFLFPLMYNIYLWFLSPHDFHRHLPSLFVSEPDLKWQGGKDKSCGLAVKWFFFSLLFQPSSSHHHILPSKSVTHNMSGQRGAGIKFSSPPRVWPESHWNP